jgi:antitoxin component YwqK of YwqJK toxin-antitoxin module
MKRPAGGGVKRSAARAQGPEAESLRRFRTFGICTMVAALSISTADCVAQSCENVVFHDDTILYDKYHEQDTMVYLIERGKSCSDGRKIGVWESRYFGSMKLASIVEYQSSGEKSFEKLFYPDGTLFYLDSLSATDSSRHVTSYWESGAIATRGIFGDSVEIGASYSQNGNLETYFEKSTLNPDQSYVLYKYFSNGHTERKCTYVRGKRNGVCDTYAESGAIKSSCEYENGMLNGRCIYYDLEGGIKSIELYIDDQSISPPK